MEHSAATATAPGSRALARSLVVVGFGMLFWLLVGAAAAHADEGSRWGHEDPSPARAVDRVGHATERVARNAAESSERGTRSVRQAVDTVTEEVREPVAKVVDDVRAAADESVRRTERVVREVRRNAKETIDQAVDATLDAVPAAPPGDEPAVRGPDQVETAGSPSRQEHALITTGPKARADLVLDRLETTSPTVAPDHALAADADISDAARPGPVRAPVAPQDPGGEPVESGSMGGPQPPLASEVRAVSPAMPDFDAGIQSRRTSLGLQPAFAPGSTPD